MSITHTGDIDFGDANSLKIPTSATPTVDTDGEFALDTNVTDWSHSVPKIYGGEELGVVTMPIAEFTTPSDGDVISYNATNDEFELVQPSGWKLLANVTLGSNGALNSGTITAMRNLRVTIIAIKTTSQALALRFNGASGAGAYTYSYAKNGGADNRLANTELTFGETNTEDHFCFFSISNIGSLTKKVTGTSMENGTRFENAGYWNDTTNQITSIEVFSGSNLATGSQMIVEGMD